MLGRKINHKGEGIMEKQRLFPMGGQDKRPKAGNTGAQTSRVSCLDQESKSINVKGQELTKVQSIWQKSQKVRVAGEE